MMIVIFVFTVVDTGEREEIFMLHVISNYTPSYFQKYIQMLRDDGCKVIAIIPQTGELLEGDNLGHLIRDVLPVHRSCLSLMDRAYGCFLIADIWGNIYYYQWDTDRDGKYDLFILRGTLTGETYRNGEPVYRYKGIFTRG